MTDDTKHYLAQLAIALLTAAAASIAAQYPNRSDLVYAIAGLGITFLHGRSASHVATINAQAPVPAPMTVNLTPMAPTINRSDPPVAP